MKFLRVLAWVVSVPVWLWFACAVFGLEGNRYFILADSLASFMCVAGLLVTIIVRLLKRRVMFLVNVTITLIALFSWQMHPFAESPHKANTHHELRVLELNTLAGGVDPHSLMRPIVGLHLDAIILVETNDIMVDRLKAAGLDKIMPYHVHQTKPFDKSSGMSNWWGQDIWSRTPLTNIKIFTDFHYPVVQADTVVNGITYTLIAVHTANPVSQQSDWVSDLKMIRDLQRETSGDLTLIGGDFNASDTMASFRPLLNDDFIDSGVVNPLEIRQLTWPVQKWPANGPDLPLMRLDHILVSKNLNIYESQVARINGCDHRAVIVTVGAPR